jgi:hydroxylamine reductase
MYCVQCEQSNKGGCAVKVGSCGKSAQVADMQDILLRVMQGVSAYARARRPWARAMPASMPSRPMRGSPR